MNIPTIEKRARANPPVFTLCAHALQLLLFSGALFSNTWRGWGFKIGMRISAGVFKKSELASPCCVALTFFCASRARWGCHFHLFQPLHGGNACFINGVTNWHPHAAWRSLLFVLPVLGGVAILTFLIASAAGTSDLLTGFTNRTLIPVAARMLSCFPHWVAFTTSAVATPPAQAYPSEAPVASVGCHCASIGIGSCICQTIRRPCTRTHTHTIGQLDLRIST